MGGGGVGAGAGGQSVTSPGCLLPGSVDSPQTHTAGTGGPGGPGRCQAGCGRPTQRQMLEGACSVPSRREWALCLPPRAGSRDLVRKAVCGPPGRTLRLKGGMRTLGPRGRGPGPGPWAPAMVQDSTAIPTDEPSLARPLPFGAGAREKWCWAGLPATLWPPLPSPWLTPRLGGGTAVSRPPHYPAHTTWPRSEEAS